MVKIHIVMNVSTLNARIKSDYDNNSESLYNEVDMEPILTMRDNIYYLHLRATYKTYGYSYSVTESYKYPEDVNKIEFNLRYIVNRIANMCKEINISVIEILKNYD